MKVLGTPQFLITRLPNKACPRLRDLATAPARGITQPIGQTLFGSPVYLNRLRINIFPCSQGTQYRVNGIKSLGGGILCQHKVSIYLREN